MQPIQQNDSFDTFVEQASCFLNLKQVIVLRVLPELTRVI
jgi:hypothetical protein